MIHRAGPDRAPPPYLGDSKNMSTATAYVQYRTEGVEEDLADQIAERHIWQLDQSNDGELVDVNLLRETLEFVTANPDLHRQRIWFGFRDGSGVSTTDREIVQRAKARGADREKPIPALADTACGTAGCLFGWAAVIEGSRVQVVLRKPTWSPDEYAAIELRDDYDQDWEAAGREVLGLSFDNAQALSHADNSVGDLWRMASILTQGEIVIPEQFAGYDGVAEAEGVACTCDECEQARAEVDD